MERNTQQGIRPDATTFGNALLGFYREEKLEDVGKFVNLMKEKYGVKQGVGVYNVRIQGLCKLRRSEEAMALMEGMMERGIKPNSDMYRNLIHGFCKEEKHKQAKELFKKMVDWGCQPDGECYFNLIYFLCKGGQFRSALNYCKESMGKGWVPNFGTMKSLVMGLVGRNMVEEAKELTAQVKEKFPGKVGLWEEVEAAFPQ
ncbi:hypothetical protein MLD38_019400 [Melastoma candidum]|uniref:Uncharacterized protein n=1 Tax=Melastoma candidum TaxID=119954 RepID=A0ACB9R0E3_9MYRT|nr:hypothetical protein MLD38_019400 [Melastoma candidum]